MPFTPGPWFALGNTIFANDDGSVCHVDKTNPDRADNIRLIQAAPNMLAALQKAAHADLDLDEYEAVMAAIKAAIETN